MNWWNSGIATRRKDEEEDLDKKGRGRREAGGSDGCTCPSVISSSLISADTYTCACRVFVHTDGVAGVRLGESQGSPSPRSA